MMIGANKQTDINNKNWEKMKQASDTAMKYCQEGELPSGFPSWPPISYSCRFCNKELRSAQALGGHMNRHKIDRAKLRLCSTLREEMTKKKAKIYQDLGSLKHKIASPSVALLATTKKNEKIDELELQIGLQKQELDLELRLGYT